MSKKTGLLSCLVIDTLACHFQVWWFKSGKRYSSHPVKKKQQQKNGRKICQPDRKLSASPSSVGRENMDIATILIFPNVSLWCDRTIFTFFIKEENSYNRVG